MNTYTVGTLVQLTVTFVNTSGVPADPSTITVIVKKPDLSEVTATPTRVSTGLYTFDVSTDQTGTYAYRFVGTGAVQAAAENCFLVSPSDF